MSVTIIPRKSIKPTQLSQIEIPTCRARFCDHCPHNRFPIPMLIAPLHLQFHCPTPLNKKITQINSHVTTPVQKSTSSERDAMHFLGP